MTGFRAAIVAAAVLGFSALALIAYAGLTWLLKPRVVSTMPMISLPMPEVTDDAFPIHIDADGVVCTTVDKQRVVLDEDPMVSELPGLRESIRRYKSGLGDAGNPPMVRIDADDKVAMQRVIDVLNALAAEDVSNVAFIKLSDES